jgi:hypothetical protein
MVEEALHVFVLRQAQPSGWAALMRWKRRAESVGGHGAKHFKVDLYRQATNHKNIGLYTKDMTRVAI